MMASLWLKETPGSPGRWFERMLATQGPGATGAVAHEEAAVVRLARAGAEEEASQRLLRVLLSERRVGPEAFKALLALLSTKGKAEESDLGLGR